MDTRLKTIEYDYNEVGEEALTPSHLIYGRRIKTLPDEVAEPDDAITRGAARGDIFARHLAAHQRIWN